LHDPKLVDQLESLKSPMTRLALEGMKTMFKVLNELDGPTKLKICSVILGAPHKEYGGVIDSGSSEEESDVEEEIGSGEEVVPEEECTRKDRSVSEESPDNGSANKLSDSETGSVIQVDHNIQINSIDELGSKKRKRVDASEGESWSRATYIILVSKMLTCD
jgi:hypothetical protein